MTIITYGDPAYPNFTKWVDSLATTTLPQAQSVLVKIDIYTGEVIGYCCMGQGCTLVPEGSLETIRDTIGGREGWLGAGQFWGESNLAPSPFLDWLGCGHDFEEHDIHLDIPDEIVNLPSQEMSTDRPPPRLGADIATAATLNDAAKLTFPQIADMLRYFGIEGDYR